MKKIRMIKALNLFDLKVGDECEVDIDGNIYWSGGSSYYYISASLLVSNGYAKWVEEEKKEYWSICEYGIITKYTDHSDNVDEYRKSIGNYFTTREEAETSIKVKQYIHEINEYIRGENDGFDRCYVIEALGDGSSNVYWTSSEKYSFLEKCSTTAVGYRVMSKFKTELDFIRDNYRRI